MNIDAHQHFIQYSPADYPWIDDSLAILRRDFAPSDLANELNRSGIDGSVAVQARQTLEETRWLLDLANDDACVRGVVGWVPLTAPEKAAAALDGLADEPFLIGVRHVVHDEPDDQFILRGDFNRGIDLLLERDLTYDILIFERHLPQTIEFVDRHPNQRFVIDHIAKPKIRSGELEPWRANITKLAKRENVFCKLSGMVTEADPANWTPEQLAPYAETVLEAFGPDRLMFGSDWPVCLIACDYPRWRNVVGSFIDELSPDEQAKILGETAAEFYRLPSS